MADNVSYQVGIPKTPPAKTTSLVEFITGIFVLDPDKPDGTSWIVKIDSLYIDNYIAPNYGAGYAVAIEDGGKPLAIGSFTFDYLTGKLTLPVARSSTEQLRMTKGYRARVINPEGGAAVDQTIAFGREAKTGSSRRFAREDHNHGSPTDPVPIHAGDANVHHKLHHDHSTGDEGSALAPGVMQQPRKFSAALAGETFIQSTLMNYMTDEAVPVEKTLKVIGDPVAPGEHGDLASSSSARHNYNSIDGTHNNTGHTTGVSPSNVTKSATVEGTSSAVARADHKHDISTTTPSQGVNAGDSASEGSSSSLARSDHQHSVSTGTPSTVLVQSNTEGSSTSLARSDHLHNVSTSVSTPATVGVTGAGAGSGTALARSDHIHAIVQTGTQSSINAGDTASKNPNADVGVAAVDHRHAVTMASVINTDIVDTGTANALGASTKLPRADHVHRTALNIQNNGIGIGFPSYILNFRSGVNAIISGTTAEIDTAFSSGLMASRADPTSVISGTQYWATDLGLMLISDGISWHPIAGHSLPTQGEGIWDDFIGDPNFAYNLAFGGSSSNDMVNGAESIVRMQTGTTTASFTNMSPRSTSGAEAHMLANAKFLLMVRVRSNISGAGLTASQALIGLADGWLNTVGSPTNGIFVFRNSSDWNYLIKTAGGASSNIAAVRTGTGYFTFFMERTATAVNFFADTLLHPAGADLIDTTTLPSSGVQLVAQVKNNTDVANATLDVDYWGLWNQR